MSVNQHYVDYVLEQLEGIGTLRTRRMFGGLGIYLDELFFALIADDILRFKVDESNRDDYMLAGMEPFRPYQDKTTTLQYYEVPIEVLEDRKTLANWARKAYRAGLKQQRTRLGIRIE
ncbi:MAG: TfoX/Sxy family protein [Gammaproteobacteria bacterium]|nr:TfoX/Sxy family protein [Gammaproteobacteria bacterium]